MLSLRLCWVMSIGSFNKCTAATPVVELSVKAPDETAWPDKRICLRQTCRVIRSSDKSHG
jgi:hypothetical protein